MIPIKPIYLITGHYGSGKTSFSTGLALWLAKQGFQITVVDYDLVNPYFRTADFASLFKKYGIELIAPLYSNTNLDIPSIALDVQALSQKENHITILDIGGDDDGATPLGVYSSDLNQLDYAFLYVFNTYRYHTQTTDEAFSLLKRIEQNSRLHISGLINNSNLGALTTKETIEASKEFATKLSLQSGLPLIATCADPTLQISESDYFPIVTQIPFRDF